MKTSRTDTRLHRRGFIGRLAALLAGTAVLGPARRAEASTEPYLGEIMLFAGDFAPRGWAQCNGQFLSIAQNQGLFSLLGTTYGGNGVTTFALPDLRDRVPIHYGQGSGLSPRALGEQQGAATHTLVTAELPVHSHGLRASSSYGNVVNPAGAYPARNHGAIPQYATTANAAMAPLAIGNAGASQPHDNTQPYLGLNFCICLVGIYPTT